MITTSLSPFPVTSTAALATTTEASTGTDSGKIMTPQKTAQAIAALGAGGGGGGLYTVSTLPDASTRVGQTVWVSDGNNGQPCLAASNGTKWLRVLPGEEVRSGNLPLGCIAWWKGENDMVDTMGNFAAGTANNTLAYATGYVGQAFDTAAGFVTVADDPAFRPDSITVEFWARLDVMPVGAGVFATAVSKPHLSSFTNTIGFFVTQDGTAQAIVSESVGGSYNTITGSIAEGVWNHWALTFDGDMTLFSLYKDGELANSVETGYGLHWDGAPWCIGDELENGSFGSGVWPGLVDEVTVYNRALSAEGIEAIYDLGASGKTL